MHWTGKTFPRVATVVAMLGLAAAVVAGSGPGVVAQTEDAPFDPAGFGLGLDLVADGFDQPLYLTDPGDGSDRLFVVERPGHIHIVRDGQFVESPFLDIVDRVGSGSSEQGLLSVAFHPDYAENGTFYANYTDLNGDTVVSRFRVSDDPDRADPASETLVLAVAQPFPNHNGGLLKFGPDGYLYVGLGDGGAGGDPENNAQNPSTLLGSILRIDVDPAAEAEDAMYDIPADNPFVDDANARPETWAYGLRNPWRFSFDRATGDLYIADVGQNAWEEVSFQPADSGGGENYGWPFMEGTHCYPPGSECDPSGLVLPLTDYAIPDFGCAVTGGYVYRGEAAPALEGVYIFGDYCSGLIWGLGQDAAGEWIRSEPVASGLRISSFGEDAAGDLYVIDYGGAVHRIVAPAS